MNKYNAARAAGFSESTAKVHTKELEERAKIADVLERQGLTDNVLVKKHRELLEAAKVILVDGKPLEVEKGSCVIPEYQIQIKALELAYKLKDLLKDKIDISGAIAHNHFYKEIIEKPSLNRIENLVTNN
jgi:phage terminase small subunit